jgi:hypothetical protein
VQIVPVLIFNSWLDNLAGRLPSKGWIRKLQPLKMAECELEAQAPS